MQSFCSVGSSLTSKSKERNNWFEILHVNANLNLGIGPNRHTTDLAMYFVCFGFKLNFFSKGHIITRFYYTLE